MNPHKLTLKVFLLVILVFLCAEISFSKGVTGGRRGIVVDERLAALRRTPQLNGALVRRLGRGRIVYVRGSRTTSEGVVFLFVNVTTRTRGWIQREAVASPSLAGDDRRLLELIKVSNGFDQIVRARIFLDHFLRSPLRPQVLLLLGNAAEEQAAKLSREAAKRLSSTTTSAPLFTYFLNYTGLDRYNRQRVTFLFNPTTKRYHYEGAAWRDLLRHHPNSPEALAARERLAQLAQLDP
ncbi:MAG TPA: hypothetical protein VJS13_17235 [Pyrinomonadaceae bacterium]|nr:hypothetical protein [Pyrinomonadaceae bacterium]